LDEVDLQTPDHNHFRIAVRVHRQRKDIASTENTWLAIGDYAVRIEANFARLVHACARPGRRNFQ
jgi:hypothetical protein